MKNLHLGCFNQPIPGWINTDITPHLFVARLPGAARLIRKLGKMTEERYQQHLLGVFDDIKYVNLGRRFPFDDNSFENVFSAHVLEHLHPPQAINCVKEVYRVIKSGGVFRVSVPDLDLAIRDYDPKNPDKLLQIMYTEYQSKDKNRHHWMYNEHNLGQLLRDAGFHEVERCEYRQGRCVDVEQIDNRPDVSLFMEALK